MTFWACLLGSGLKFIFYWKAQLLILAKSLFSLFADVFMSCVTENKDMPSANSFALEKRPLLDHLYKSKTMKALKWILGELLR